VLLFKDLPRQEIDRLKPGDFFVDAPVLSLRTYKTDTNCSQQRCIIITTLTGSRFTAHPKIGGVYNVFKKRSKEPTQ
jgi:hypothetical protein